MKFVKIGDTHRIVYSAKNYLTGLVNITGQALSPSGAVTNIPWSGTDPAAGFCELGFGLYYTDFATAGKTQGTWAFKVDSATKSNPGADSIILIDGDTLNNTPFEKLDTMLDTALAAIQNGTSGLVKIAADAVAVLADTTTIKSDVTTIKADAATAKADIATVKGLAQGGTGFDAIKTVVDAVQSAIGAIGNSTKNTLVTPDTVRIPSSGVITKRVFFNIFDNTGNMEDPDSELVELTIYNEAGANVSANFLSGVGPYYMTKDAVGQYHIDYEIAASDAAQDLRLKVTYNEGSALVVRDFIVALATTDSNVQSSLAAIDGKIDVIDGNVDAILSQTTTIDGNVDTILSEVSGLRGSGFNGTTDSLKAISDRTLAIEGAGFATGTDSLKAIRDAIEGYIGAGGTIATLVTSIQNAITNDIKGTGFNPTTDSMHVMSARTIEMQEALAPGGQIV